MYLTEITPSNLRGAFGTGHQLFITIGIFIGSVLGLREIFGEFFQQVYTLLLRASCNASDLLFVAEKTCNTING